MAVEQATFYSQQVVVSLAEMLCYGHQYEHFVDLLRDRVELNSEDERELVLINWYGFHSVVNPDFVEFTVHYDMEY